MLIPAIPNALGEIKVIENKFESFTVDKTFHGQLCIVRSKNDSPINITLRRGPEIGFTVSFHNVNNGTVTLIPEAGVAIDGAEVLPENSFTRLFVDRSNRYVVINSNTSESSGLATLANTYDNSLAVAIATIGSNQKTIVIDEDTIVSTDIIIPSNIDLVFQNGAQIINGDNGGITFEGPCIQDTTRQIFSGFFGANEPVSVTYGFATLDVVNITLATDNFYKAGHGFQTGLKMMFTSGTFQISGVPVSFNTNYWIIRVDADNFKLASSNANALAGIPVDITAQGVDNNVQYLVTDIDTSTDTFYTGGLPHGFITGRKIRFATGTFQDTGVPVNTNTLYYVIRIDDYHYKIAHTYENALAGIPVDLTWPGYTNAIASPVADIMWTGAYPDHFRPEWWDGSIGDGSTDSIAAFDSMFQSMRSDNNGALSLYRGGVVKLSAGKTYYCESTLRIRRPVVMEGVGLNQTSPSALLSFAAGVKGVVIDGTSTFDRVVGKQSGQQTEIRGVNLLGGWGPNNTIVNTDGTHILLTGGDIQQFSPFGDEVNGSFTVASAPHGTMITINGYDYIMETPIVQTTSIAVAVDLVTNLITGYNAFETGLKVYVSPAANLPAPLVENTPYYVIKNYADVGKYWLALSLADAVAGIPIDLTTTGSSFYVIPRGEDVNAMSSVNIQKPRLMVALTAGPNTMTPIGGNVAFPSNNDWAGQTVTFYNPDESLVGSATIISHTTSIAYLSSAPATAALEAEISGLTVQTGIPARLNVYHGLEFRTSAKAVDMLIYGFSGSGVAINSQINPTGRNGDEPNGNNSWMERIVSEYSRGHGFSFYGSNTNNISTFLVDATTNFGYGVFESGTSGGNHWGFHTSFNTYGACSMTGAIAANMVIACYTEGQQPHARFGGRGAVVLGGNHGAGIGDHLSIGWNNYVLKKGMSISNTKPFMIGFGSQYNNENKTMMTMGASEEFANISGGGFATLPPILPSHSFQYDWPHLGHYGWIHYDQVAGVLRTPYSITGSQAAIGGGQLCLPDGFRTGDGVNPVPVLDPKINRMIRGTFTVDPASIAANTVSTQTFTLTGAVVGDNLVLNPPAAGLTAGLVVFQAQVSAANTVSITFMNTTGAPIDEGSANWSYLITR